MTITTERREIDRWPGLHDVPTVPGSSANSPEE